jgi:hypothetical protein
MAAPLAALAAAFQANAEALRRSQEVQADLGRALQRADRSEMVVQTTGALNDTFKNLSSIQRGLLQRLEESGEETRRGRWFLPAIVLASLAVVGVAIWFVMERVDGVARDVATGGDVADRVDRVAREAREEGRREADAQRTAEVTAIRDEIDRLRAERAGLEERLQTAERERDAEREARRSSEADMGSLRSEVTSARADLLARRALEEENARLRAEATARQPELDRLRRELEEEKKTTGDLRLRVAEAGLGRVPAEAATSEGAPAGGPAASPAPSSPPPGPDPSIVRDRRQIERVRTRVNELLQGGNVGRSDFYQVQSIGGLSATRLVDVVAMRYAPNGRLQNAIHAKELRVVVDRTRHVVEFAFTDGALDYNGTRAPFPEGGYSAIVAEGDLSGWTGSGLTFVTVR